MKYVAQLSSKKCFVSCGFILAKLEVIFPWGKGVLLEPSREEGVFSWGLFFLVTGCVEGQMARGVRTHQRWQDPRPGPQQDTHHVD